MKYLIWLFLPVLVFSQVRTVTQTGIKKTMIRGDFTILTWTVPGNHSIDSMMFVVKASSDPSSPRLIQKFTGGGGITATYSGQKTTIAITMNTNDTQGFTAPNYNYDITSVTDSITLVIGVLAITGDISSPTDGIATSTPYYTVALDTPNTVNTFLIGQDSTNRWYPRTTAQARTILGIDTLTGVNSLPDSLVYDSQISDMVTKSGVDTITGEKDFSASKTVFSGDSVRVTGDFQTNRIGIGDKYGLLNNGLMLTSAFIRQQSNTSIAGFQNQMIIYDVDYNILGNLIYGLTSSSGAGIFSYNLTPYSAAFNSGVGLFLGVDSYMSLGLYPLKTYMEIDSLKFGSLINNIFNPVNKVTFVADTFNITGTTIINGSIYAPSGSVTNADSLGGEPAANYVTKAGINTWSTNLYSGSENVMRLGKSYADRRFNNGAYGDVWIIDYVVPPYNLSASWLFPIEHRTDYYNDTLQTISSVANIFFIDTVGTGVWRTNDVNISGVETQIGVGDLPDSTGLVWANTGLFGNRITLSEANLTATPKRFPMKIKGFSFELGHNNYYTYPELYSYYSNLASGNLERAWHFYGEGDYPSYFGGDLQVAGDITDGSGNPIFYSGSDSIDYDADSVIVTHGVGEEPLIKNISITLNSNSFGYAIWVDPAEITSTTFMVRRSSVGLETMTDNIKFSYQIRKE